MMALRLFFQVFLNGSDEGIVFLRALGRDAEEMVGEPIEIAAVANQHAMFMNQVKFQRRGLDGIQFTEHVVSLGLKDSHALYLT